MQSTRLKVIVYGGNGFVGTHLAQRLSSEDACVVCLSRSGHKPLHLNTHSWSESIRWCKGDANKPDSDLLKTADVVVILVGSAPIPTFSRHAYEAQLNSNGSAPQKVIECAAKAGVKRVVIMGAKIPFFLKSKHFAYSRGKDLAAKSAQEFSELSPQHSAIILQPSTITGKRHLQNGKVLALDTLLFPFAKILPSQFISISRISQCLSDAILNEEKYSGRFTVIKHSNISHLFTE